MAVMPSLPSPPISPSCAAPRIRRKWWRRPMNSALPPSASPTATALPAWCAPMMKPEKRKIKFLVGVRLVTIDGFEVLAYPTDRDAYGRLCRLLTEGNRRAKKGECHLTFEEICAASEGQMLIALPPDDARCRISPQRLAALAEAAPGRVFLAAVHRHRGDEPRRFARLAELAQGSRHAARRRQRRALSRARAAAARRCAHLHPREMHHRRSGLPARRQCRAPSQAGRGDGAAVRRLSEDASRARSRSPRPATSRSAISNTNIPTSRCRPARRRSSISTDLDLGRARRGAIRKACPSEIAEKHPRGAGASSRSSTMRAIS